MNFLICSAVASSFAHCSLYSVTGKRPRPYTDTAPFSLTLSDICPRVGVFSASFSAFSRSISACISSSVISPSLNTNSVTQDRTHSGGKLIVGHPARMIQAHDAFPVHQHQRRAGVRAVYLEILLAHRHGHIRQGRIEFLADRIDVGRLLFPSRLHA